MSTTINNIEDFLQSLNIPPACELNKSIFKKMLLDSAVLDIADKASLKEDVEKIRWLYTLKPNTINIAPYIDKEREYPEVAILHVELSSSKRMKRIAHFINRAIPYPLVLLFTCVIEDHPCLAISLADKRINQADKEKWVIEDNLHTNWIKLYGQTACEAEFLSSLEINNLSFKNFFELYKSISERVIAINCAIHSGNFLLENDGKQSNNIDRLSTLRELEKLSAQKAELESKLKKEKQMGKQVELNTHIKQINDDIAIIKGSL